MLHFLGDVLIVEPRPFDYALSHEVLPKACAEAIYSFM